MDKEFEKFQVDLLQSIKEMKADKYACLHQVKLPATLETHNKLGLSQPAFAEHLEVSKRASQEWEKGQKRPSGVAKELLQITTEDEQPKKIQEKMSRQKSDGEVFKG